MRHGSLFSGIGGFDLAAEWMGWENVFHCEKEKFCQTVLNHYWPKAKLHEDIRNTDFTIYRDRIDILTGGFPCQPYSTAGKRLGKEDDRHLWPEMLRAIREISPRWIVGENVRGLTNWNGGMVFDEVQADLEAEGYKIIPLLLPACAVNAPHRRDRIWFIAHRNSKGLQERFTGGFSTDTKEDRAKMDDRPERQGVNGIASNANGQQRCEGRLHKEACEKTERYAGACHPRYARGTWENFPTQSPVCGRDDGLPSELDGITFSKWRNESIKGYGNAIVPQVVLQIFKAIEQYEAT